MSKIKHNEAISIFQMVLQFIQNLLAMVKKPTSPDLPSGEE